MFFNPLKIFFIFGHNLKNYKNLVRSCNVDNGGDFLFREPRVKLGEKISIIYNRNPFDVRSVVHFMAFIFASFKDSASISCGS